MPLHGQNLIGQSFSAEGSATFQAVNPATGQPLDGLFHAATAAEVRRAVASADAAFRLRGHCDPAKTVALLDRIATGIEALGDALIERCGAETGLGAERLRLERARTCSQLRLFARLVAEGSWVDARIDRAMPDRKPAPKPEMRRMLVPIGPVAVFPASNFPLAFSVAGGDTASALAAGCPVIVKARPQHPGTSELVGEVVREATAEAGLPDGWFSMLHGPGRDIGADLVRHPAVQAVGFTGSLRGGRTLMDVAAARPDPIPVYAEMGSINPVFLLGEALDRRAEQIAEGFHRSLTLGAGQFCTNPGIVVAVEDDGLLRFLARLGELIEATAPATMLMASMLEGYQQGVQDLARIEGVELAARSRQPAQRTKTQCGAAVFVTGSETFLREPRLRHEVFGPAAVVVRCAGVEALREVAESFDGQLTATIHAESAELGDARELVAILERKAGRLVFNGFPTGLEVCPSTHHGGPYPAASDMHFTSVGTAAVYRFARPVCYQDFPERELPPELRDHNERAIWRLIDGAWTKEDVVRRGRGG
jgi:2,5-dioxopentanoate dehydrogenase